MSLISVGLDPEGVIEFLNPFIDSKLENLNLGSNPSAEKRNRFNEESCTFLGIFLSQAPCLSTIDFANS